MKRKVLLAAVIGITVLIAAARWRTSTATQSSFAPILAPPCQVALAQGPQDSDIDRTISELQKRARQPRGGEHALEQLGYQYIARARVNNDPGDYKLAEHAADCLESRHANDPAALLVRRHALHQLHRFREAEAPESPSLEHAAANELAATGSVELPSVDELEMVEAPAAPQAR